MAIRDPQPCAYCGLLPSECSCHNQAQITWKETGTNTSNWNLASQTSGGYAASSPNGYTTSPNGYLPLAPSTTTTDPPWWPQLQPPVYNPNPLSCFSHEVDPETVVVHDDAIAGFCKTCRASIKMPRIPGGLTFEHAGSLIGRAMSLDEADDESMGELLGELNILEHKINKETARYRRALKLIAIARDLVAQHVG